MGCRQVGGVHVSGLVRGRGQLLHGSGPDAVRGDVGRIRVPGSARWLDQGLGRATDP